MGDACQNEGLGLGTDEDVSKSQSHLVLLWLEPPLANDFCNFLNKIAKIMKIFVEVDLLKSYQPLCQC